MELTQYMNAIINAIKLNMESVILKHRNVSNAKTMVVIHTVNLQWIIVRSLNHVENANQNH